MFKRIFWTGIGLLSTIYVANPTAGIIELIPDNIPIAGNLDEAIAVLLILVSLRYFGIDVINILNKKKTLKGS